MIDEDTTTACQSQLSGTRFLTIVLGGPLVGAFVYLVAVAVIEAGSTPVAEFVSIAALVMFMGWPIGLFPALIAAIIWAFLPVPRARWRRVGLAALIGASAGIAGIALAIAVLDLQVPSVGVFVLLAVSGTVAMLATALPDSRGK